MHLRGAGDYIEMRLFRLGRLQFAISEAPLDIPSKGLKAGATVIEVHIPGGSPLTVEECLDAFARAKQFFATYFPTYSYKYYICFSWLFDDVLGQFLKEDSNILKFQKLFEPVHKREEDCILRFMFRFHMKSRDELSEWDTKSSFAKKVKEYAMDGGTFYNVLAVREADQP